MLLELLMVVWVVPGPVCVGILAKRLFGWLDPLEEVTRHRMQQVRDMLVRTSKKALDITTWEGFLAMGGQAYHSICL